MHHISLLKKSSRQLQAEYFETPKQQNICTYQGFKRFGYIGHMVHIVVPPSLDNVIVEMSFSVEARN